MLTFVWKHASRAFMECFSRSLFACIHCGSAFCHEDVKCCESHAYVGLMSNRALRHSRSYHSCIGITATIPKPSGRARVHMAVCIVGIRNKTARSFHGQYTPLDEKGVSVAYCEWFRNPTIYCHYHFLCSCIVVGCLRCYSASSTNVLIDRFSCTVTRAFGNNRLQKGCPTQSNRARFLRERMRELGVLSGGPVADSHVVTRDGM